MPDRESIYWAPEWEASKGVRGAQVPVVTGDELVAAMNTNVLEAQAKLAEARTNLHRARAAGAVVVDSDTNRLRVTMVGEGRAARQNQRGVVAMSDWQRAMHEVLHWQEYLAWAREQSHVANSRSDARLPPEHEDEEVPF